MLSKNPFLYAFFIVCSACIELEEDNCSEYTEYMCNCHADDPNYNCSELKMSTKMLTHLHRNNVLSIWMIRFMKIHKKASPVISMKILV